MIYLLIGYMWLFVHRPFEVWEILGTLRIERIYIILCIVARLMLGGGWVRNRINVAFFGFALSMLFCWLASPYASEGQHTVEEYFKIVVFYVLVMSSVRTEADLRTLVIGFLGCMTLYMAHSFREFLAGRHVYRMGIARMVGVDETAKDPNSFAATICYALPIIAPFWLTAPNRQRRWLLLGYVGLSLLCVLLTGSRSGFACLGFLGLILVLRSRRRGQVLLLLVLALPAIWVALPADLKERYASLFGGSDQELKLGDAGWEGRTKGFYDGLAIWSRSPLTGAGPGVFGLATGSGFQSHNLYGQILGEMGSLGVLCVLAVLYCLIKNWREGRRLQRTYPGVSRFLALLIAAVPVSTLLMLVKGFGDHNLYRYNWLWFGAFQACALQLMHQQARREAWAAYSAEPSDEDAAVHAAV